MYQKLSQFISHIERQQRQSIPPVMSQILSENLTELDFLVKEVQDQLPQRTLQDFRMPPAR